MIFADKLVSLRKQAGWSQEDLAQKLNVSRQSVSKWEGAQSVPEIDKLLQISGLFGVTLDYLLKDDLGQPEYTNEPESDALRKVTLSEATDFLKKKQAAAPKMALATALCIISPVPLLLSTRISQNQLMTMFGAVIGLGLLLVLVAAAVWLFMSCGSKLRDYKFLETDPIETEYGVSGLVRERAAQFSDTYDKNNAVGTVLCILAAIPVIAEGAIGNGRLTGLGVSMTLCIVALGCSRFVRVGVVRGAMDQLLEEGDYTRENKRTAAFRGRVIAIYWLVVTALFLFVTFGPYGNGNPGHYWLVWAIAGVLFGAVCLVLSMMKRKRK